MKDLEFRWYETESYEQPERFPVILGDRRLVRRDSGRIETVTVLEKQGDVFMAYAFIGFERFTRYFTEAYLRSHTVAMLGNVLAHSNVITGDRLRFPTQTDVLERARWNAVNYRMEG